MSGGRRSVQRGGLLIRTIMIIVHNEADSSMRPNYVRSAFFGILFALVALAIWSACTRFEAYAGAFVQTNVKVKPLELERGIAIDMGRVDNLCCQLWALSVASDLVEHGLQATAVGAFAGSCVAEWLSRKRRTQSASCNDVR